MRESQPGISEDDTCCWKQVRQNFVQTLTQTIHDLQFQHGYSRERAIQRVYHEILTSRLSSSDSIHSTHEKDHHDDQQVQDLIQRFQIGHYQANQAMAVARVVRFMSAATPSGSYCDAVEKLTLQLSRVVDLADENPSTETPPSSLVVPRGSMSSSNRTDLLPSKNVSSPAIQQQQQQLPRRNSQQTQRRSLRKRELKNSSVLEDSGDSPVSPKRPRADSLTEEVSAKFADAPTPTTSNKTAPGTTATATNNSRIGVNKRPREEETTSGKRSRTTSA